MPMRVCALSVAAVDGSISKLASDISVPVVCCGSSVKLVQFGHRQSTARELSSVNINNNNDSLIVIVIETGIIIVIISRPIMLQSMTTTILLDNLQRRAPTDAYIVNASLDQYCSCPRLAAAAAAATTAATCN